MSEDTGLSSIVFGWIKGSATDSSGLYVIHLVNTGEHTANLEVVSDLLQALLYVMNRAVQSKYASHLTRSLVIACDSRQRLLFWTHFDEKLSPSPASTAGLGEHLSDTAVETGETTSLADTDQQATVDRNNAVGCDSSTAAGKETGEEDVKKE